MNSLEHHVRERAYFIWEGEGRQFGHADAHWLRAERELHEAAGPLLVQRVDADLSLAPSPAQALDKTLKAKASRTRSATAKAAENAATAKAPAKPAAKVAAGRTPAKTTATKTTATKTTAAKPASRTKAHRPAESSASIH